MTQLPLDTRTYQDYVDEAVARIPIHNPEWRTDLRSDPGVTILELFAFMAESIGYRANQIPERNRRRFLSLVGGKARPATAARGLISVDAGRSPLVRTTLGAGLEVRAGDVPFRTERGLDVLPVQGHAFYKQKVVADEALLQYHRALHAAQRGTPPALSEIELYDTVAVDPADATGISLADTADGALWIALTLRDSDAPTKADRDAAQLAIAGSVLSLGIVPVVEDPGAMVLQPVARTAEGYEARLDFAMPQVTAPAPGEDTVAAYRPVPARWSTNVLVEPGVIELTMPSLAEVGTWSALDPLVDGTGNFPPSLQDTDLAPKLVTWLRISGGAGTRATLLWVGLNATTIVQRTRVEGEILGTGSGEPGQKLRLARTPVVPGSAELTVGDGPRWTQVDELLAAGPELAVTAAASQPGLRPTAPSGVTSEAFVIDPASGEVTFGDGVHGARPQSGREIRVSYDVGGGALGNVAAGAVSDAPDLGSGMTVANPVRTWGGADPESTDEALAAAARGLQHGDRAVTKDDVEAITWRTPGVMLGRVDVLPAFSPELAPGRPGDAAGAMTVVVVPRWDAAHPEAPTPDRLFLEAVCQHLDPRRLVTTEVFVRGPSYRRIWITVGIEVEAGWAEAEVREAVRARLSRFLIAVDPDARPWYEDPATPVDEPFVHPQRGWPLGQAVTRLELIAVANRVPGVRLVNGVVLGEGDGDPVDSIALGPLELPAVAGVGVAAGDPPDLAAVRGSQPPSDPPPMVPVPRIPDDC